MTIHNNPRLKTRERQVLTFVAWYIDENGFPPSQRDIMHACGYRSVSAVGALLRRLADKGYVQMMPNKGRALRLLKPIVTTY